MKEKFTDTGLEALFFDSSDALHACVEERDIRGALLRLENMRRIVNALEVPRLPNGGWHLEDALSERMDGAWNVGGVA